MTTDYARGLEDAAKALEGLNVSSTSGPIERAMRLVQSEGAARIRSLAPAQGVEPCIGPCCIMERRPDGSDASPPLGLRDQGKYPATPDHIQVVFATMAQVRAFNLRPDTEWVIYFIEPESGARAQTFAVLRHYPGIAETAQPLVHVDDGQGFRRDGVKAGDQMAPKPYDWTTGDPCPHGRVNEDAAWCLECEDEAIRARRGGTGKAKDAP